MAKYQQGNKCEVLNRSKLGWGVLPTGSVVVFCLDDVMCNSLCFVCRDLNLFAEV